MFNATSFCNNSFCVWLREKIRFDLKFLLNTMHIDHVLCKCILFSFATLVLARHNSITSEYRKNE